VASGPRPSIGARGRAGSGLSGRSVRIGGSGSNIAANVASSIGNSCASKTQTAGSDLESDQDECNAAAAAAAAAAASAGEKSFQENTKTKSVTSLSIGIQCNPCDPMFGSLSTSNIVRADSEAPLLTGASCTNLSHHFHHPYQSFPSSKSAIHMSTPDFRTSDQTDSRVMPVQLQKGLGAGYAMSADHHHYHQPQNHFQQQHHLHHHHHPVPQVHYRTAAGAAGPPTDYAAPAAVTGQSHRHPGGGGQPHGHPPPHQMVPTTAGMPHQRSIDNRMAAAAGYPALQDHSHATMTPYFLSPGLVRRGSTPSPTNGEDSFDGYNTNSLGRPLTNPRASVPSAARTTVVRPSHLLTRNRSFVHQSESDMDGWPMIARHGSGSSNSPPPQVPHSHSQNLRLSAKISQKENHHETRRRSGRRYGQIRVAECSFIESASPVQGSSPSPLPQATQQHNSKLLSDYESSQLDDIRQKTRQRTLSQTRLQYKPLPPGEFSIYSGVRNQFGWRRGERRGRRRNYLRFIVGPVQTGLQRSIEIETAFNNDDQHGRLQQE